MFLYTFYSDDDLLEGMKERTEDDSSELDKIDDNEAKKHIKLSVEQLYLISLLRITGTRHESDYRVPTRTGKVCDISVAPWHRSKLKK